MLLSLLVARAFLSSERNKMRKLMATSLVVAGLATAAFFALPCPNQAEAQSNCTTRCTTLFGTTTCQTTCW
jgi:hypothetical protein